jgi:hypothetical protein
MVEQSTWGTNEQIYSFLESDALCSSIHASDQQPNCFVMKMTHLFGYLIHLNS